MNTKRKTLTAAALLLIASVAQFPASALAADKITLKLTTWTAKSPGFTEWWPAMVKDFEAAHPGVEINLQHVAFGDFVRYATTQFVAGSPPDIVHVPLPTENLAAWADAGFLDPMDKRLASTDIPKLWPKSQAAMVWKGVTYGVLYADYGFVMFYNEALFKAAGVSVPQKPDELLAAAAKLTKDGKYGFAITDDQSPSFVRGALNMVTGMGGEWAKDGKWNWTDPKVIAGLDLWRKLARDYSPKGTDNNAKRQAFYDGNVAMMIENPAIWPNVKTAAKPSVYPSIHLARVPMPFVPGDTSHGFAIATGVPEARAALAWDFIQLASSDKWQREYVKLISAPVARPGASDSLKGNPDTKVILDAAAAPSPVVSNAAVGVRRNFNALSTALADSLRALLHNETPTVDVMRELEKALAAKRVTP